MAIIPLSGRAAIATLIKDHDVYLAWGTGDAGWDTTPVAPTNSDDDLEAELGRRQVTSMGYVTPDLNGSIVLPGGAKYSTSVSPTTYLYVRTVFEFTDEPTATIRECGLWQGTVPTSGHESDAYLAIANVGTKGLLLTLDRFPKITRSGSNREIFEFVLQI